MKYQTILSIFFIFSGFVQLNAQEGPVNRALPASETQNIRAGEAAGFQYQLRRFEAAFKERDQQSVDDLKAVLVELMDKRIKVLEAEKLAGAAQKEQLAEQEKILKEIKDYPFSLSGENQKEAVGKVRRLQRFALLMTENF
ncbi:MAG TPA: hypothetical protein ENJ95_03825 [Bacteroidetes bacterium]|nr:hypothetical protein [Bacteroidota bacterium]